MNPQVLDQMANQHGLILRRQAVSAGMPAPEIDLAVRSGVWRVVRRGVYVSAARWEALGEWEERPRLLARAASLNMGRHHVLSHDSAALMHTIALLPDPGRLVHVTRFGALGGRTRHGVKHHKAPHVPGQLIEVDGLWCLDRSRTVLDLAREHGLREGLVACDSARRLGEELGDLDKALEAMTCWPGVTVARRAVSLSDPGAESPGESLSRLLLVELGLGPVQTQFGLRDEAREGWADLRIGRHLVEFDGHLKLQRDASGPLDPKAAAQVLWKEKKRQDWLCGFKLGMSRLTWTDIVPQHWEATKVRVAREILDTNARFGVDISNLSAYRLS